jgi:uncharacterized protein (DUF2062 family)
MLLAALLAVLLRCNLPLSVGLVWVTNPVTLPAIIYLAYEVGSLLVPGPVAELQFSFSYAWFEERLLIVWKPLLVGCLICGLFFGSLGYFVVNVLWRWRVARQWRRRRRLRATAPGAGPGPAAGAPPAAPGTPPPEHT